MTKQNIYPDNWQTTRGVYSPAMKIDLGTAELIFVSGQQPRKDEKTHKVIAPNDIEAQTEDVFQQISEILKASGASMQDVVKVALYFTDFENDFEKVSAIRDKWLVDSKPASTCLECNRFSRIGAKIEIEVTAIKEKP